jgi:hypothetical protein
MRITSPLVAYASHYQTVSSRLSVMWQSALLSASSESTASCQSNRFLINLALSYKSSPPTQIVSNAKTKPPCYDTLLLKPPNAHHRSLLGSISFSIHLYAVFVVLASA